MCIRANGFHNYPHLQAGINNDDLKIALEPEAASLYSRKLPVSKMETGNGQVFTASFKSGDKYMVIDAGGKI